MTTTYNTITVITGKNTDNGFKEETWIIPKNVENIAYFQLAVQFHVYDLFESKLSGELNMMEYEYNHMPDMKDTEKTLKEEFGKKFTDFSTTVNEFRELIKRFKVSCDALGYNFNDDLYARLYACVKTGIKTIKGEKQEFDKKGNIKWSNKKVDVYDCWSVITDRTKLLQEVFDLDTPCKKERREQIFDYLREIMEYYIHDCTDASSSDICKFYKNINCKKVGARYFSEYYSTTCRNRNGKNGGITLTFNKNELLLEQLAMTMFRYLGCNEIQQKNKTATGCNENAINELKNQLKLESQETSSK